MKNLVKLIVAGLVISLVMGGVGWTIPQLINYHGKLTNTSGVPVNGGVSMTFTLYDAASGGTNLWAETQSVTVNQGLYNVQLGSGTAIPGSVFSGNTVYLGVKVGADAEMTPRTQILAVGYAYRAGTAEALTSTASIITSGNITTTGNLTVDNNTLVVTNTASVGVGTATLWGGVAATGWPGAKLQVRTGADQNAIIAGRQTGKNGIALHVVNDNVSQNLPLEVRASLATFAVGSLEVAQNKVIKLGDAYLSSGSGGGNAYAHLANREWYDGTAWQTDGTAGGLYQISNQIHTFYTHDGAGAHTANLQIQADGTIVGRFGTYHAPSDARLKKDITSVTAALEKVLKLRGVNFRWKDFSKDQDLQLGMLAQEVEKIVPEVVRTADDGIKTKAVEYQYLVALLVEAIKEQYSRFSTQADRISRLERELSRLQSKVENKEKLAKVD